MEPLTAQRAYGKILKGHYQKTVGGLEPRKSIHILNVPVWNGKRGDMYGNDTTDFVAVVPDLLNRGH